MRGVLCNLLLEFLSAVGESWKKLQMSLHHYLCADIEMKQLEGTVCLVIIH